MPCVCISCVCGGVCVFGVCAKGGLRCVFCLCVSVGRSWRCVRHILSILKVLQELEESHEWQRSGVTLRMSQNLGRTDCIAGQYTSVGVWTTACHRVNGMQSPKGNRGSKGQTEGTEIGGPGRQHGNFTGQCGGFHPLSCFHKAILQGVLSFSQCHNSGAGLALHWC